MFAISRANREILHGHAIEEYPHECCGVIVGPRKSNPAEDEVKKLTNTQNRLHREDPEAYPRDARTAYLVAPEEFYSVKKGIEKSDFIVKAIYHSHPEHEVYFSPEDEEKALILGDPTYDNYFIMSVFREGIKEEAVFRWEPSSRLFIREEVEQIP